MDAASMIAQLGDTTKDLVVSMLPVGEAAAGVVLGLATLMVVSMAVALSFRSALR